MGKFEEMLDTVYDQLSEIFMMKKSIVREKMVLIPLSYLMNQN